MGEAGTEHLIVGVVRKPHGIRGELVVQVETDRPAAVFRPGRVLLLGDTAGRAEGRTLTVERARPFKEGMLVRAREFPVRDQVMEELRGLTQLIPRGEAEKPDEDEVFYHELVGMRVRTAGEEGEELGVVRELYEAPSGFLLGVQRSKGKELLLPFVREMVRRIDRDERVLEVEIPAGLLDL